ncbi:MAG: ribulose-phosphate 3-epimerase, partial [Lachnospiraceae bacterium]|nr:ribulose-phosphate 3-epimerase [Lachnospiraceae bacterium]MDU4756394.1 ribulose-phosphate 3-epimerase [Lachnospiraceae bacterium]
MEKLLCPSLLNLSMDYLKDEIMRLDVSGADILHIDVMDGHYVPNFGMSFQDIETIRKNTSLKLDVHMMMYNPGRYIERYAEFGADIIYIHPDSETIPTETLCRIRKLGKAPGIVINPGISLDSIQELLSLVDYVLVMTVNPGFAGRDYLHFVEPNPDKPEKLFLFSTPCVILKKKGVFICYSLINT